MENKFLKIINKKQWQELLNRTLFKTFFHNLEWENFLEKQFDWLKFERYAYKDSVLLSLARVRVGRREKLVSHPFCEYGGPLPLIEKIDTEKFIDDLFSEFKIPFNINIHPYLQDCFKNFKLRDLESWRDTYWLENFSQLKQEELFASFRYDIRHLIQKAEKQGFSFGECRSKKELEEFYKFYIKTTKRHKNIPLSFSFFDFFWRSQFSNLFFLKSNGKIVVGSVFLFYRPFIHYFITAADYKFRKLGVNHLLLWLVIEKYIGKDYDFFDLGATKKGSALEIFKRGWRGKQIPLYGLSNQPDENRFRDSKLRELWGLLPEFLIKKFSPYLLKYKL